MNQRSLATRSSHSRRLVLTLAAASTLASLAGATSAQTLTWDAAGQGAPTGGSGHWDTTSARWTNGSGYVTWPNAGTETAVFAGTRGYVLVPGAVSASDLGFGNDYTLYNPGTAISTISLGGNAIDTGANRVEIINPLAPSTGLVKNGNGILVFHAQIGTGPVQVNGGTLAMGNTAVADLPANLLSIASGAAVDLSYNGGAYNDTIGALEGGGNVYLKGLSNLGVNWGSRLSFGNLSTSTTFSGNIVGAGRIQKQGTGSVLLSGNNSFRVMDVQAGTVELQGGNAVSNTGNIYLSNVAATGLLVTNSETIGSIGGGGTTGGVLTVPSGVTLTLNASDPGVKVNVYSGAIEGAGTIVKSGPNIQVISGSATSSYTGKWVINQGTLAVANDAAFLDTRLGTAPASFESDNITLAGGVLSNTGSGFTLNANRGINVTAASGVSVFTSAASNLVAQGSFSGSASLTKTGIGVFRMDADNAGYSGDLIVRDGALGTARGLFANPLGTGNIDVQSGTLSIAPGANGGVSADIKLASGAGKTMTFGPGAVLLANRNTGNTDLKITIGDAAATSNTLVRGTRGTLVVQANSGIALLGTAGNERVFINGFNTGTDLKNGIVPGVFGTTSAASTPGELLTYNTVDGLKVATYSSTDITTSTSTDTVSQTVGAALAGPVAAYALKVGDGAAGTALDLAGNALTIGSGTDPGMLVVNTASTISNGTLDFGSREAVIYAQGAADNISSVIKAGSLSKVGAGPLVLQAAAEYSGATHISQGTIVLNGNNQLPVGTDVRLLGAAALNLNGFTQEVGTFEGTTLSNLNFGTNGILKMTGSGDTKFQGTSTFGTGSTTATLWKAGPGVLQLGQATANLSGGVNSAAMNLNKLWVTDGGVVQLSSTASIPNNPAVLTDDTYFLDNGTIRVSSIGSGLGSGSASTFSLSAGAGVFRGLKVGANGGTIDVTNPLEIVLFQRTNGETVGTDDRALISGAGNITKVGPGAFRVGVGNVGFTGRWIVKEGILQFQTDDAASGSTAGNSLGATPGVFQADLITLDGGALQANGSGIINANRGITVTANNGTLVCGGTSTGAANFTLNSVITGPGTLTKIGLGQAQFRAANTFEGGLVVANGVALFQESGSAGLGQLTLKPEYPVTFGKTTGSGSAVLSNDLVLQSGSTISLRVDNSGTSGTLELAGPISGPNGFYRNSVAGSTTNNTGTLVLSGTGSTFSGAAILQAGTTVVRTNNALGAISGPTIVNAGGALAFDGGVNYSAAEPLVISGTGLTTGGTGALLSTGAANTFAGPVLVAAAATIDVTTDLTLSAGVRGASDLTVNGTGTLAAAGIRVNTLNVNNPRVAITAGRSSAKTSQISTLNLGANTLDLNDNDLVVSNTTAAAVRGQIISGQITSTVAAGQPERALGSAQASDVLGAIYPAPFSGVQVQSGTDVVVRYTYRGDATLNGQVDSLDFNNFLAGYGLTTGGTWVTGDFNYDDKVNTIDFNYLAGNFGATPIASPTPAAALGSVVPEPGSLSLVAIALAGLAGRRRRN